MGKRYPEEMKAFVADHIDGRTNKQLAELVNETFGTDLNAGTMKTYINNHHLHRTVRGRDPEPYYRIPKEHREFILAHYKGAGYLQMAVMLREEFGTEYTFNQIKGFYGRNHLDSGCRGFRFTKETCPHPPKGTHFCPETEFKKGHRPHNWKPVGSERTNADGTVMVKTGEKTYEELAAENDQLLEELRSVERQNDTLEHACGKLENENAALRAQVEELEDQIFNADNNAVLIKPQREIKRMRIEIKF